MTDESAENDPKGLIAESYRMRGLSASECRSIFLDWALSVPPGEGMRVRIMALLDRHGVASPDHPMTGVLRAGLDPPPPARRRGGWKSRRR